MWWSLEIQILLIILIPLLILFAFLKYRYSYWPRHRVAQIEPSLMVGNLGSILKMSQSSAEVIEHFYNHPHAKDQPIVGIYLFHRPALLIREPELVKRVLVRDFNKFCNRYSNSDDVGDPLGSQNLFFLKNPAWKAIRLKLTPFFSSNKLKQMLPLVEKVGQNLNTHLLKMPLTNNGTSFDLELKEFCALFTTDVIATVAFGVEANSFTQPNGEFRRNGREIFRFHTLRGLQFIVIFFLPQLVPYLGIKVVPPEQTEFLRSTFNYVLAEREKSGQTRNDLIDILLEFRKSSKVKNATNGSLIFDGDIMLAQAAIFFTAGFESSSASMSFALYEMAKNPQVQQKLREEIQVALMESSGEVTPKIIDHLEYMQMIINETLRLYPPLPFLDRDCTVEKGETYSFEPFNKYGMPQGMPAYIPVYALHRDPKYFPNPSEFIPERFSRENRKNIVPYTYLPFGLGSHACIGERFAALQIKIGLFQFLRNHRVVFSSKTLPHLKLDPRALILQSEGGIHLSVERDPLVN